MEKTKYLNNYVDFSFLESGPEFFDNWVLINEIKFWKIINVASTYKCLVVFALRTFLHDFNDVKNETLLVSSIVLGFYIL